MELKECILTRRSVRKFTDQKVDHALLEQIIAQAAFAPSWKNTQISRYIAIEDPALLSAICETYAPFNKHIISTCSTLLVQTFVTSRSGFDREWTLEAENAARGNPPAHSCRL